MKYECVKAKSLLSKKELTADSWFHINRSLNAYRGCEHGCIYCDGMNEYYHVDNFMSHIRIKENAPEILKKELKKLGFTSQRELETETLWSFLPDDDAKRLAMKRPRRIVIGVCGGVSDGFQPAEREHKITQQILETLVDFRLPAMILTKSDLVLRDIELLKELNEVAFVNAVFTITLHDDEKRRIIEPRASSTPERFTALKELRKSGIPGGVMATPIVPWIGTDYENIEGLAREAKKAKAEFILFGGMTLKPGRQKEYFMRVINHHFPEHADNLAAAYANENRYGQPIWQKLPTNVMLTGHQVCSTIGISDRSVRHTLPYGHEINYKVLGILLDIEFYQNYLMGLPWKVSEPFHELSVKLERGVEDLQVLREEGRLKETLLISNTLVEIIEQITETGSCEYLKNLLARIPDESSGEQKLGIPSDEVIE
ncbi:radical SAM protein [Candidatus Thorarchaeota archaeon]|nr:MAG: radical SAM protein [Candidatus Thorarchaeota archaeon]